MNVIKQIVGDRGNVIKMIVRDNERGPQGEQGVPGVAATIEAGNVYSISQDDNPAVINTGTSSNAVFDFYLPKGVKGDPGTDGKDGAIQYTAGSGIKIEDNVISATGGGGGGDGVWGAITGNIADQTDLQQEFAKYTQTTNLATVATTGAYSDLTGTPSIPDPQVQSDWNQSDNTKVDYIKNKPTIPAAQVNSDWDAVSGVTQILNKPTIPTVYDATITITNNGTTVDSFTVNASSDKTIALTAPVITMTTTDPGEGSALAANNFIAVYDAS